MKKISTDGFVPIITFKNSFWIYFIALGSSKIVAMPIGIFLVIVLTIFGISGIGADIANFSLVLSLLLMIFVSDKIAKDREIKKHLKELEKNTKI